MPRPRGSRKQREQEARLATGRGRLVGYLRVSTEGQQNHGHSLAGQEQRLREACERAGFELAAVLQDVASGSKADRDGLTEAQALVEAGQAEGLVFAKFDRVTRSMLHGAALVEWARGQGYTLLSADEGAMVTQGRLTNEALPFFQALAQVERERISRRTREGLAAAKARGVTLGSRIRTQATDPAAVRAVQLRRAGQTIAAIAVTLNAEGYRTARGCKWASGNTYTLLRRVDPDVLPEGGTPRHQGAAGPLPAPVSAPVSKADDAEPTGEGADDTATELAEALARRQAAREELAANDAAPRATRERLAATVAEAEADVEAAWAELRGMMGATGATGRR